MAGDDGIVVTAGRPLHIRDGQFVLIPKENPLAIPRKGVFEIYIPYPEG